MARVTLEPREAEAIQEIIRRTLRVACCCGGKQK
jgi:hypothetical protein